jgi:hypothetical protein
LFGSPARRGDEFFVPSLVTDNVPLVLREVLVDSNEPEHLSSWSLEVEVGIRHFNRSDARVDDLLPHRFAALTDDAAGPSVVVVGAHDAARVEKREFADLDSSAHLEDRALLCQGQCPLSVLGRDK